MEEKRMDYYSQEKLLASFGDIINLINDQTFFINLLSSDYDRHILGTLIDMVNKKINSGEIGPDDLKLLRSGFLTDVILDLPNIVSQKGRNMYKFEIGDKLNYLSSIKDIDTLIASYTNDYLIDSINKNKSDEFGYFISSGSLRSLPPEVQTAVAEKFISTGNIEMGIRILQRLNEDLTKQRKQQEQEKYNIEESNLANMFK